VECFASRSHTCYQAVAKSGKQGVEGRRIAYPANQDMGQQKQGFDREKVLTCQIGYYQAYSSCDDLALRVRSYSKLLVLTDEKTSSGNEPSMDWNACDFVGRGSEIMERPWSLGCCNTGKVGPL
jgi:hypothetical protein